MAQIGGQVAAGPGELDRQKALKILAKSIFKELRSQGYEPRQVVGLATELIALVTGELAADTTPRR